jgi:hypothetical protein
MVTLFKSPWVCIHLFAMPFKHTKEGCWDCFGDVSSSWVLKSCQGQQHKTVQARLLVYNINHNGRGGWRKGLRHKDTFKMGSKTNEWISPVTTEEVYKICWEKLLSARSNVRFLPVFEWCKSLHPIFSLFKQPLKRNEGYFGLFLGRQRQLSVQIITESLAVAMHNPLSYGPFCVVKINHMDRGPLGPP